MLDLLVEWQSAIRAVLTGAIGAFADLRDPFSLVMLLPLGVVFGVAHALTPGHGKTVLATYAVGSDARPAGMVLPALTLTATHIGSAVLLAIIANDLVSRTIVGAGRAPLLETISQALLIALGGWLLLRAVIGRRHAHGEGFAAGFVAGLMPCPLTLFLMFYAMSRGVPEAGLLFALAMLGGVGLVLVTVATGSAFARHWLVDFIARRGGNIDAVVRMVDGMAGLLLVVLAGAALAA